MIINDDDALERLLERVARKAAHAAVKEAFTQVGVDISSAPAVIEAQRDFSFLRDMRQRVRAMAYSLLAGGLVAAGAAAEGVHMLDSYFRRGGT